MTSPTTTYTNLGSLGPTSFPSDCLQSLWQFHTSGIDNDPYYYFTQGCAASTCCPSSNFYTDTYGYMSSYYSPGVCPSEYRTCPPPLPPSTISANPGETIAFCCPTAYGCPETIGLGTNSPLWIFCQSLMLSSTTTYFDADNIFDQKTTATGTYVVPTGQNGMYILAFPIQIRNTVTQTGITTTPTSPLITTPITHTTTSTFGPSSSNHSKSSLSVGAIAGIAVGAFLVGALILAVFGFVVYRSIMRRLNTVTEHSRARQSDAPFKPELDGQTSVPKNPLMVRELDANQISHELDGSHVG